ncbi:hypothetical protein OIU79_029962 [Salix purpurea]|uniref:Uncharacterized protein n=1 Tax=Salix purpurea TaxID=77065 RepID=A0A9Q0ZW00_SALPP|nr:hypothetical protein OIU79_029962 [Salix purpurea]
MVLDSSIGGLILFGKVNQLELTIHHATVLGKVRDFLGVISEANKRLQADAKENSEEYDIEVLTGNESEVVEMDLMLGIADLHTPEAVAAAEAAIAGGQSMISLAACSSETESEDSSDESESDDGASDDTESNGEDNADDNIKTCKSDKNDSTAGTVKQRSKKQKIVELS